MSRFGLFLTSLLVLNACAITRPAAPPPGLDPVPADSVVVLAPGAAPPENAVTVEVFAPSRELDALTDPDLLRHYAPRAGRRGANHVTLLRVGGRRMVRAYYVRISVPVAVLPADSAGARRLGGGSSASPSGGGSVHVRGYYRRDGTYVRPHTRSRPGSGPRSGGSRRRN